MMPSEGRSAYDQVCERALGNMMDAGVVPPVLDVAVGADLIEDRLLSRFAQGDDEQDFVASGNLQGLSKFLPLDQADHAPGESLLPGTEENTLSGDAVVAAEGVADLGIADNDDVGIGPFALRRSAPALQVPGPRQKR